MDSTSPRFRPGRRASVLIAPLLLSGLVVGGAMRLHDIRDGFLWLTQGKTRTKLRTVVCLAEQIPGCHRLRSSMTQLIAAYNAPIAVINSLPSGIFTEY